MSEPSAASESRAICPVVGIGASAGGLEAVSALLAALPESTGMAFVLVQHLDPEHDSMLAEILAKKTAMSVAEARDGMPLVRDHLYVIPPNATLALSGEALQVTPRDADRAPPGPIDTLFRSLAAERGRGAVGMLLSGTGSDGTRGAQAIKEAGGIVLVQEPGSAAFDAMPQGAIRAGVADAVLRPAELAHRLAGLAGRLAERVTDDDESAPEAAVASGDDDEHWKRIFRLLRGASGIDFTHYKRSMVQRRIERRQTFSHLVSLGDYTKRLEEDTAELNALAHDVLIGVTSFFRDPETFEALSRTVFPALLGGREPRDPLRIWVPGCSSGEEVYSIAVCLMEHLGERAGRTIVQFFGTDASEAAIMRARRGIYPEGIEAEISPERLRRYFVHQDHHYQVAKPIRDLCVFARHDVTRDPPFSRLDLVSCRNLLIYLDAGLQRQALRQLHYSLKPQGFLLLGPSETIGASADLFEMADKKRRVYTPRVVSGRAAAQTARESEFVRGAAAPAVLPDALLEPDRVQQEADRLLLARYAPAAIVVDEDLHVHQFRGETALFLAHASGPASLNLQQLAPPALLVALVPALREARGARTTVRREHLRIEMQGRARNMRFEVSPFRLKEDTRACYLVVFEEEPRGHAPRFLEKIIEAAARRAPVPGDGEEREQLERELAATREFLQSSAEEHEATKEELKSLHEEALSANEELQSTNEELETAKEELQSANEELSTTNDELRTRNQQLGELNNALVDTRDFAEAIIETVRHPLLVLDRGLRVRQANEAFYRLFRATPQETVGRLLYDLGNRQWNIPRLRDLLEDTLAGDHAVENFRVTLTFESLGERTMLLNARRLLGKKVEAELILVGIEDATERLRAADSLHESDRRKDDFLAMLGHELRNPLAPIRAVLDVIRGMNVTDENLRWGVEVIDRQSEHMVRLVDDLLEMSRMARGTLSVEIEDMALGDAVQRAIEAARPLLDARRHHLSVDLPPQHVAMRGDQVRLTQLFTNLLTNAGKYTPVGGEICLALETEGSFATVTVSDNGQGIAAARLPHLFEPFGQDGGASRTGLGIGLPLARRVAKLHGGTVEAGSEGAGKGSVFTVKLPLPQAAPPEPAHSGSKPSAAQEDRPELDGCRVLVVDDNVDAANSLQMLLGMHGCDVRCAYDGGAALSLAAEFRPEVVLLDLALPDTNGYDVLRRLRAAADVVPAVIALSGYAQPADRARIKDAGFDGSLTKPVDVTTLVRCIASLLHRPG